MPDAVSLFETAAANPAGCSSARVPKPTPTPTSTSRSRSELGKPAAQSSGPGWIYHPGYNSEECQPHIFDIFDEIEQWLADETKYEAVDILRKYEVPCAILAELGYDTQTVARMRAAGVVG
jgi:crotonobetainyl-CoA:carnitine CoA-transferase CaiB-like acyl-CoA transferase